MNRQAPKQHSGGEREPMPADIKARLREIFRPEVARLGEILGRDLSHWNA
jgi:hypothetical protein